MSDEKNVPKPLNRLEVKHVGDANQANHANNHANDANDVSIGAWQDRFHVVGFGKEAMKFGGGAGTKILAAPSLTDGRPLGLCVGINLACINTWNAEIERLHVDGQKMGITVWKPENRLYCMLISGPDCRTCLWEAYIDSLGCLYILRKLSHLVVHVAHNFVSHATTIGIDASSLAL